MTGSKPAPVFAGRWRREMCGEPFWICYDHDGYCRRATGGALIVWVGYRPGQFHITRGRPSSFSRTKGVTRTFCSNCGTSISYADDGLADELYLALGFFDHPERFPPKTHAYVECKLPWLDVADDLNREDGYTRRRDPQHGDPKTR